MKRDYDLVIIGSSSTGLRAAVAAANQFSRIALVLPQPWAALGQWQWQALEKFLGSRHLEISTSLTGRAGQAQQWRTQALTWAKTQALGWQSRYSPAVLASLGIDVVPVPAAEPGQFQLGSQLVFTTVERQLSGRHYLLALEPEEAKPAIPNSNGVACFTPNQLLQVLEEQSPQTPWVILGDGPVAYSASQMLLRLGLAVTVLMPDACFFPLETAEVSCWLQAQLEAEGGQLFANINPEVLSYPPGRSEWAAGNLAAQGLLWCGESSVPANWLNLRAVGVQFRRGYLQVNPYLQTTHPQIFACGALLGGYPLAELADQEAMFILRHLQSQAFWQRAFWQPPPLNYGHLSWSIGHGPTLARIGLVPERARQQLGNGVRVLYSSNEHHGGESSVLGQGSGFCQLVTTRGGQLLGATILGPAARERLQVITLVLQQGLPISTLSGLIEVG